MILVTAATGQVGREVEGRLAAPMGDAGYPFVDTRDVRYEALAPQRFRADLEAAAIERFLADHRAVLLAGASRSPA